MFVIGIDPGFREFGIYFGEYFPETEKLVHIKYESRKMIDSKKYNFKLMKQSIRNWYLDNKQILMNGNVIIERQPFLRFVNICNFVKELVPHAIILDTRGVKKMFGISTGNYRQNKRAVVEKFGYLLPKNTPFKKAHNLLDPFVLVLGYLVLVEKIMSGAAVTLIEPFSKF